MECCNKEAIFLSVDVYGKEIYFCKECQTFPSHPRQDVMIVKEKKKVVNVTTIVQRTVELKDDLFGQ